MRGLPKSGPAAPDDGAEIGGGTLPSAGGKGPLGVGPPGDGGGGKGIPLRLGAARGGAGVLGGTGITPGGGVPSGAVGGAAVTGVGPAM